MVKRLIALMVFFSFWATADSVLAEVRNVGPGERYPTIQLAVEAAESGDIIQIKAGTYFSLQPVVIAYKDRLTLLGQGSVHIMTPNLFRGNDYLPVIAILHSTNIAVDNIHAMHERQPVWGSGCGGAVITVEHSANVNIEGCELNGSGAIGIQAAGATNLVIKNNYIHHNSFSAFDLRDCAVISIKQNRIEHNNQLMQKANVERLEVVSSN